jgi:hypothetical protein
LSFAESKGAIKLTQSGCLVEVYTTTDKKGTVKSDYPAFTGQPFSILRPFAMARTFKLHNVAAFYRFYHDFPDKTSADLDSYTQVANESSHQCRYTTINTFNGPIYPADGSTYEAEGIAETTACWNWRHIVQEPTACNSGRKGCRACQHCSHNPKCMLVQDPTASAPIKLPATYLAACEA